MWQRVMVPAPQFDVVDAARACGTCTCGCAECNCNNQGTWKDGAGSAAARSMGNATAEVIDPAQAFRLLG